MFHLYSSIFQGKCNTQDFKSLNEENGFSFVPAASFVRHLDFKAMFQIFLSSSYLLPISSLPLPSLTPSWSREVLRPWLGPVTQKRLSITHSGGSSVLEQGNLSLDAPLSGPLKQLPPPPSPSSLSSAAVLPSPPCPRHRTHFCLFRALRHGCFS